MKRVAQYQVETGARVKLFPSVRDAAEAVKGRKNKIYDAIASNCPAYGYLWAYADDSRLGFREEKRDIQNRLISYRRKNGLGCFKALECRGLTAHEIREMLDSAPLPIEKWRRLGKALDKAEARNGANG